MFIQSNVRLFGHSFQSKVEINSVELASQLAPNDPSMEEVEIDSRRKLKSKENTKLDVRWDRRFFLPSSLFFIGVAIEMRSRNRLSCSHQLAIIVACLSIRSIVFIIGEKISSFV